MKGLFIRIDPGVDRDFTRLCKKEGYKKGATITRLIRDFVHEKQGVLEPIKAAQEFGIDTTLLKQNLQKSTTERLKDHTQFVSFLEGIRKKR